MLQRSPTFFVARPNNNELADTLRQLDIPDEWTHEIVRKKILFDQEQIVQMSFQYPDLVREELYKGIREILGEDYDVSEHFEPAYRPWQQRIALIPDGDLFHSIAAGDASVVTDEIATFVENGIQTASGELLKPTSLSLPRASISAFSVISPSLLTTSHSISPRRSVTAA